MGRSDMATSGLMKILRTTGPYACRARIVLRNLDEDRLYCHQLSFYRKF